MSSCLHIAIPGGSVRQENTHPETQWAEDGPQSVLQVLAREQL